MLAERIGATVAATPAEAAATADVTISMVADDDAVRALLRRAGRGRRRDPGGFAWRVDCSTVLPDAIRSVAGAVRARDAGILDAPVSGSTSSTLAGELTIMVGGEAADLDPGTADPRSPRPSGLPPRAARDRRGDEARGQHPDLRAQRRGRRRPPARRAERDRPGARLRRPRRERGRGALRRLQAQRVRVDPETTPVAFSLGLADKDLRLIDILAEESGTDMPQARSTSRSSARRRRRWARTPISRPLPATCDRRAADDRAALRRRPTATSSPDQPDVTEPHEGTIDDRPIAHQGWICPEPGPDHRRTGRGRHPGRGRQDRGRRPEPLRGRGPDHRRHRRHRHPGLHRHPPAHVGDVDPDVRSGLHAGSPTSPGSSTASPRTTGPTTYTRATCGALSSARTPASRPSSTGHTS